MAAFTTKILILIFLLLTAYSCDLGWANDLEKHIDQGLLVACDTAYRSASNEYSKDAILAWCAVEIAK